MANVLWTSSYAIKYLCANGYYHSKHEYGYELLGISLPAEVELLIKDSHVTNNFLRLTPFQTVL
jgi:hypothetical protein